MYHYRGTVMLRQPTPPPQDILERLQRTAQATGCSLPELLRGWITQQGAPAPRA